VFIVLKKKTWGSQDVQTTHVTFEMPGVCVCVCVCVCVEDIRPLTLLLPNGPAKAYFDPTVVRGHHFLHGR